MRRKIVLILVLVLVLAAGAAAWWKFSRREQGPKVLATVTLERGTVRKVLEATGIVKPQVGAQVQVGARASGTIEKMLVKVGDHVKQGDLIAVIDARELAAQLEQAEATVVKNRADMRQIVATFPLRIAEAEADVRSARAQADYAQLTRERQRELVERDLEARDKLDDAIQKDKVAESALAAKEATLVRLKEEFVQSRIKAEKTLAEAEAARDATLVRLTYTRIYSPIDGIVSQVTAEEGETVVSGLQVSNLITILAPDRLEMWIYVDETDVGQVSPGMPVEYTVDAYPREVFHGVIDRIYPQPEIRDNIVYYQTIVEVSAEQAGKLRPEMTTQCQIIVEVKDSVLALPNNALKWIGSRQVVFVQEPDGSVREVTPQLGLHGLNASEVVSGLSEGDKVATQLVLGATEAPAAPPVSQPGGRPVSGPGGGGGGRGGRS